MKRIGKYLFPVATGLLLLVLLAGCAASGGDGGANSAPAAMDGPTTGQPYTVPEVTPAPMDGDAAPYPDEYEVYDEAATGDSVTEAGGDNGDTPALTVPQDDRKVVLNADLTIEALEFTKTCDAINAATEAAGGYVAGGYFSTPNASAYGGSYTLEDYPYTDPYYQSRSADYTIKVPAENYTAFMAELGEAGNVTNRNETSEDITRQYVDVEARLRALRAQEARLLELMESAASLKDLLTVQEQLTEVQYEIEDYTATQKTWDDLVAYSTVTIHVYEVQRITENEPDGYGERLGAAFRQSWQNFADFFREFSIGFVYVLPGLIVLLVIVVVVLLILRRVMKKRRARAAAAPPHPGWAPGGYQPRPVAPAAPPEATDEAAPDEPPDES